MSSPWPPTSNDLNVRAAESIVPVELYNLLAWCIGASNEPTIAEKVSVSDEIHLKLLSICQDIVYLSSKGKLQTPKSLCLGLTIRHLTGSSQVLSLLSRLGHCSSKDTIVRLETSLAQLQLLEGAKIPAGFSKNVHTVLVWDNIDFGEETLSGRGTTHHTNGIMLQSQITDSVQQPRDIIIDKKLRSIKSPNQTMEHYHQQ